MGCVMTEEVKAQLHPLKIMYLTAQEQGIQENDWEELDITQPFLETLKNILEHKELIEISIKADTVGGKSTVGLWLLNYLVKEMKKQKKIPENQEIYPLIQSDEQEFVRYAKKNANIPVLVDEHNATGTTGANATAEWAEFTFIQEVCAQQFVHRIYCSPTAHYDRYANFRIEIVGNNKREYLTIAKLVYTDRKDKPGLPLGLLKFNVKDILNTEWHEKYRKKKFARMQLLTEHGKRDVRELEQSKYALELYQRAQELASVGKITPAYLDSLMGEIQSEDAFILSLFASTKITQRALVPLRLQEEITKLKKAQTAKNITYEKAKHLSKSIEIHERELLKDLDRLKKDNDILDNYKKID